MADSSRWLLLTGDAVSSSLAVDSTPTDQTAGDLHGAPLSR